MTAIASFEADMPVLPNAACKGVRDPEIFYADSSRRLDKDARLEQARNICRRCPEIRACLTWALTHHEEGVWAATTEAQRAELLARHSTDSDRSES